MSVLDVGEAIDAHLSFKIVFAFKFHHSSTHVTVKMKIYCIRMSYY